jgi:DNA-binding MarR family transcriptional regulator
MMDAKRIRLRNGQSCHAIAVLAITRDNVPMRPLTQRQREVLNFILKFFPNEQRMPSVREIGEHFSISPNGVTAHLHALAKKGFIALPERQKARAIKLLGVRVMLEPIKAK